jgi:hypothetical protein
VEQARQAISEPRFGLALVTLLTAFALAVHGYHPYAEDGGIYLSSVKRLLNPSLYPHWSEFVTEHQRFSLFAPIIAAIVRTSHVPLMTVWFLLYVASFWLTLFAAWLLVTRCYVAREASCGAVTLLAVWLTIPIAGTSLMLMDPYLSARSFSTPCSLFAMVGALDLLHPTATRHLSRNSALALCLGSIAIAAILHPLMAAYALGCVLLLCCLLSSRNPVRIGGTAALCILAVAIAAILYWTAPAATPEYTAVAMTRAYWFVGQWHWYEQFGLIGPLAILAAIGINRRQRQGDAARALALTGMVAGAVAILVAALFARTVSSSFLVARLQPLRIFQVIYLLMILAIGAELGQRFLQRKMLRWTVSVALLATITLYTGFLTFPNSAHIELPQSESTLQPRNQWEQAFIWGRNHTPVDAVFALDAHYVSLPGEDAQTFRAIAERSALADYSKDGGETAITPALTPAWLIGQAAQTGLNAATDAARIAALRPLGVGWIILPSTSRTSFVCDYANWAVKVCRLPGTNSPQP